MIFFFLIFTNLKALTVIYKTRLKLLANSQFQVCFHINKIQKSTILRPKSVKLKMKANFEEELYNTIIVKFLLNLPNEEKKDSGRLCYHCEKAYYYYQDNIEKKTQKAENWENNRFKFFKQLQYYCNRMNLSFTKRKSKEEVPNDSAITSQIININPEFIVAKLGEIKPICGAIIFNEGQTKVLVIKASGRLGFPKGKWNELQRAEECAARQVQQETGLYIHNRIRLHQKVQFMSRQKAQSIFFIVRGVNENQKIKIDTNQISEAFWMRVSDISKFQNKFAERSRDAWKLYLKEIQTQAPKMKFQDFIETYTGIPQQSKNITQMKFEEVRNPLLNFKFDQQKLLSVFK